MHTKKSEAGDKYCDYSCFFNNAKMPDLMFSKCRILVKQYNLHVPTIQ